MFSRSQPDKLYAYIFSQLKRLSPEKMRDDRLWSTSTQTANIKRIVAHLLNFAKKFVLALKFPYKYLGYVTKYGIFNLNFLCSCSGVVCLLFLISSEKIVF
jgi:hypothetical protein